jgi:O-antigen/teichoic acid export membrane protein
MTDTSARGAARERALLRSALAAIASRGGTTLATLLLTPALVQALGIDGYGVLMTLTLTNMLLLLGDFGISNGLVSKLSLNKAGPEGARAIISSSYAIVASASALGLVVAGVLAVVLPWNSWTGADGVSALDIHVAAFIAFAGAALQLTTNLGQKIELARQRAHAASFWLGVANIGGPAVATIAATATHDIRWSVAGMALTPPLVFWVQSRRVIRSLPEDMRPRRADVSRALVKTLLSSGAQFTGIALLAAIAFQLDTLIVSSVLGSKAAATYSVTVRVFGLVSTTINVAVIQLWSAFADATKHGDIDWARRTLVRSTTFCAGGAAVLSTVLFLVGKPVVRLWLGDDLVPSTALLAAAAVWTVVSAASAPLAFFLNGNEKFRAQLVAGVPMAICNIGVSLWLVQSIGTSGVLWASSIAAVVFVWFPLGLVASRFLAHQSATPTATPDAPRDDSQPPS